MTGKPIPFDRAFWRPPLAPLAAYELERRQICQQLGLNPLVSITDHDTLEACAELNAVGIEVPYSLEWTVPYHGTVFHVGVHNLPAEQAREFEAAMAAVGSAPVSARMHELLAAMSARPGVLLVLNHPFSCEARLDRAAHIKLLHCFLAEVGRWLHALELNGLQPVQNNLDTIGLAGACGLPLISGGDRHCCEPNANLNLTSASTFEEFVQEIRIERRSSVLFMPQYRDPIPARYIEFIWHAVRNYPELTGRSCWLDRVFVERESGDVAAFAEVWPDGGPAVVRGFVRAIGILATPAIRTMLCRAIGGGAVLEPEAL